MIFLELTATRNIFNIKIVFSHFFKKVEELYKCFVRNFLMFFVSLQRCRIMD